MKSLIPFFGKKDTFPTLFDRNWFNKAWENPMSVSDLIPRGFPTIDISEDDKEVCVKAEVPGMSEKDIELTYHDGVLNFSGEKTEEKEEKKKNTYYKESYHGSFSRSVPLENVDWNNIHAKFKHGTLTVTAPKTEAAKANKVKIES